eukprot:TRINITY_DN40335_c0_g1_i1.p1 TRINITY_DN40335_c0_g1~~TRINITY_DN40335_c0_g1_i1.p1  ORF type:complete len:789 (+),score=171.42 TRINITY_DN40335_c0_g1_i1:88-2454(+)
MRKLLSATSSNLFTAASDSAKYYLGREELEPWLEANGLSRYLEEAIAWCRSNGAAQLEELEDAWEVFAEELNFTHSQRGRLAKACSHGFSEGFLPAAPKAAKGLFAAPAPVKPQVLMSEHSGRAYTLLEQLGRGGEAVVYRCESGADKFAVKMIRPGSLRGNMPSDNLMKEAAFLLSLSHPKIVKFHDVIDTNPGCALIMEFVSGGDLGRHIGHVGRLSNAEARHVFVQVVHGLKYIHLKDIIHRDLKLDNILIDRERSRPGLLEVKISDFGMSKRIRDGYSQATGACGTRQYWAPEVSNVEKQKSGGYDERVDLWSLGVVLYVMLVGQYPFDNDEEASRCYFSIRRNRDADELAHHLICLNPNLRIKLDECLRSTWVRKGELSDSLGDIEAAASAQDDRPRIVVRLPRAPRQPALFKADLDNYARKYRATADLRMLEVIVSYSNELDHAQLDEARSELRRFIELYFPDLGKRFNTCIDEHNVDVVDEENAAARKDELESLQSIYPEFTELGPTEWTIDIPEGAVLRVWLPAGYPATEPPTPFIECTQRAPPFSLAEELLGRWSPGVVCVFDWVEHLREHLRNLGYFAPELPPGIELANMSPVRGASNDNNEIAVDARMRPLQAARQEWSRLGAKSVDSVDKVEIFHGEAIENIYNRSSFQAHVAVVSGHGQVDWAYKRLLSETATVIKHTIAACRFRDGGNGNLITDHDDDSESDTGVRLVGLLASYEIEAVVVMVTCKFHSLYIGPLSFKDISRAVSSLLAQVGLVVEEQSPPQGGKRNSRKKKHG